MELFNKVFTKYRQETRKGENTDGHSRRGNKLQIKLKYKTELGTRSGVMRNNGGFFFLFGLRKEFNKRLVEASNSVPR